MSTDADGYLTRLDDIPVIRLLCHTCGRPITDNPRIQHERCLPKDYEVGLPVTIELPEGWQDND